MLCVCGMNHWDNEPVWQILPVHIASDQLFSLLVHVLSCPLLCPCVSQALIKDPKLSSIVMNPHVKRSIKQKTFSDALTKAKLSPMTINLISE